jgi:hypothetical protein
MFAPTTGLTITGGANRAQTGQVQVRTRTGPPAVPPGHTRR